MTDSLSRGAEHELLRSIEQAYNQFREQARTELADLKKQIRREAEARRKLSGVVRAQAAELLEVQRTLEMVVSTPVLAVDELDDDLDLSDLIPDSSW